MLRLFFVQESGQGDDFRVDALLAHCASFVAVASHGEECYGVLFEKRWRCWKCEVWCNVKYVAAPSRSRQSNKRALGTREALVSAQVRMISEAESNRRALEILMLTVGGHASVSSGGTGTRLEQGIRPT